jgi:hypothetical protein
MGPPVKRVVTVKAQFASEMPSKGRKNKNNKTFLTFLYTQGREKASEADDIYLTFFCYSSIRQMNPIEGWPYMPVATAPHSQLHPVIA